MKNGFQKWLLVCCAVSLLLNLFLGGVIVGGWLAENGFRRPPPMRGGPKPPPFFMPSPWAIMEALPGKDHALVEEQFKRNKESFRARIKSMIKAKMDVADALEAKPFQRENLAEALAELGSLQQDMTSAAQNVFCELAAGLDQNGRDILARLLRERRPPGRMPEPGPFPPDERHPEQPVEK